MYRGNINRCYVFNISVVCGNKENANIYSGDRVEWLLWKQTHSWVFFFFALKDLHDHFPMHPFFLKNIPFLSHLLCLFLFLSLPVILTIHFHFVQLPSILFGGGGRTGDRPAHRWWSYHPSPLTVPPSDIPRQLPSLSPPWMFVFPTNVGQSVEEDDIRPPGVQTPPMERHLQALETNTWDIIKIKGWVLGGGGLYAFKNDIPLRLLRRSRDN